MANHKKSLAALCSCLRGELPKNVDWVSLIGLANDTLTTPGLMTFVDHFQHEIPPPVRNTSEKSLFATKSAINNSLIS